MKGKYILGVSGVGAARGGKPLKRLTFQGAWVHRAEAAVLMRAVRGLVMLAVAVCHVVMVPAAQVLRLAETILLPHVKGGFDLMAADVAGKRLFLAAEDNDTVEVIDLAAGKHLQSVGGFKEPKWVVYRPESHRLYVSCGDGSVRVLDSRTFGPLKKFEFKEKANNLRYDDKSKELFVGVGKTFGAIGMIDTARDTVKGGEIKLANFPKQFEVEGNRIYVNVPEANHIAVIDRKKMAVTETWPVMEAKSNVPMGADKAHKRLFIGCESGKLVVIDTRSGKSVASVDISPEPDGVWYDAKRRWIYVSCGEGAVDVIAEERADSYKLLKRVATAKGAATSLFIPELDRLCVAVPQREGQQAEMRIFEVLP